MTPKEALAETRAFRRLRTRMVEAENMTGLLADCDKNTVQMPDDWIEKVDVLVIQGVAFRRDYKPSDPLPGETPVAVLCKCCGCQFCAYVTCPGCQRKARDDRGRCPE